MMKTLHDQRGVAMLLEVVLVVVVLGMVGIALYTSHHSDQTASQGSNIASPAPTPNGNVDNAVNSLTQVSPSEGSAVDNESTTAVSDGDRTSGAASDIGGSYNENSF
jgi:predicted PurR-regulated permease PerM